MTRKNFLGNHEWAFFGWKLGAGHKFYGPKNITDVWSVKKVSPQTMEHLTQKPAELAVRAMQYSSQPARTFSICLGGVDQRSSAQSKQDATLFLMELDPPYCDVIVDRYQRFTGKPAILERTGESPIPMKPREEKMR